MNFFMAFWGIYSLILRASCQTTGLRSSTLVIIANTLYKANMKKILENKENASKTLVPELELMTSESQRT